MKRSVRLPCGPGFEPLLAWPQRCWELHGSDWLAVAVAGSGPCAPPGCVDAIGGGALKFPYGPWLCSADWFVGDAADRSVEAGVRVALGCDQPWRIASSGELAVQLADHGDFVQPGGGVD